MILPNMNGIAIAKAIYDDYHTAKSFVLHKQARFEKKRLKGFCYYGYDWQNRKTGNKYLITLFSNTLKDLRTRINFFCEVESPKGKIWYRMTNQTEFKHGAFAFTLHFFKRYGERYSNINDFPKVVHDFAARNPFFALIWHDNDNNRAVYATDTGLALCSARDNVQYANTFVSRDILKPSQLKAFDAIVGNLYKYDYAITTNYRAKTLKQMYDFAIAECDFFDNADYCYEIYNEYFEK